MKEHTATTTHLVMVTVSREGDEGVEPEYLVDVLMWGLEQHNSKVHAMDKYDLDYTIEPLAMRASAHIGDSAAIVLDDKETYSQLSGCEIREFDDRFEIISSPTLFEF